jgi:Uma2 family endonuclease
MGEIITMKTLLEKKQKPENKLVIEGINWEQFKNLENTLNDIPGVRLTYLDGALQIMILSIEHEYYKTTVRLLLEAYLRHKNIRFYLRGSATLGNREITGQKEPDESYNIGTKKNIPDLVIEIIITSGGVDVLEIYKRIGILEAWFWEDGVLTIYHLENNQYVKINQSKLLPELDLELLKRYVLYHDQYDAVTEFIKALS